MNPLFALLLIILFLIKLKYSYCIINALTKLINIFILNYFLINLLLKKLIFLFNYFF